MNYNNNKENHIEGELWKNVYISQYAELYMVSNLGRVKRLKSKNCLQDRILFQDIVKGRCLVTLSANAIKKFIPVHRLVGFAFVPNPDNKPQINHDDDDPQNNRATNLKWGTQKENIQDCHKRGRASYNFKTQSRFTDEQRSSMLKMIKDGFLIKDVATKFGISTSYLSNLHTGITERRLKIKK